MKKTKKQSLKDKFWKVFSEYIRRRDSDWQGMATCCTCGKVKHWKEMDAGHYNPKTDGLSMYFEEKNVHAQCNPCNRFGHGKLNNYAIFLRRKYGEQILEELDYKKRQFIKITEQDYERFIELYKDKIKNL